MQLYQINQERLIKNFIQFVQIPSETNFEEPFLEHLIQLAEVNNLNPYVINNNLILRKKGAEDKPKLFFCAHIDTVSPGVDIEPIIIDEIIYSAGPTILGADNKAAIAVLFETLFILTENNVDCGEIEVLFTTGEEKGFLGSKALRLDNLNSKNGYVLDSEGRVGGIELSSPGQLLINLILHGNFNLKLPRDVIKKTQTRFKKICMGSNSTYEFYRFGLNQDQQYSMSILFKTYDNKEIEIVKQELKEMVQEFCWDNIQLSYQVINHAHHLNKENQLVCSFETATAKINLPNYFIHNKSASDTNILARLGFNVANLAIGYEKIHTHDEHIAISELILLTELLLTLIEVHEK